MAWRIPRLLLIDVTLGHESGLSPFEGPVGSVWGVNEYKIGTHGEADGAPAGSVMATPDASLPYIYLPPGVCEAAAEHLPVTWNETAGLYFWEETYRSYQLIDAPSYMGFVFLDRNNENITVKVPFALLHLVIDPARKGVSQWTRYWPCKPWSDNVDDGGPGSGLWPLGRAFLQAAFIGYNYDRLKFYLAQAPGPDHGKSVVLSDDTERIVSSTALFEETWRSSWEEIHRSGGNSGTVVAIVLGVTAGLLGVTGAVMLTRWFLSARSRKKSAGADAGEADRFMGGKTEMDGSGGTTMVETGLGLPHELPTPYSPLPRAEVVGDGVVYELPVDDHHQAPGREGVDKRST
ncbi:hypothetical protein CMUS01_16624 [Colletotrichum musicola]|uniref:Peptidase A1 domain-containing protein n=1 Tax=Colletotrichum musicola TaxID=2175873 RepID=A0A8H6IMA2_9PEZI|nr:hypothetical protein CMUS01_16624 [Colletotrichum musicola]